MKTHKRRILSAVLTVLMLITFLHLPPASANEIDGDEFFGRSSQLIAETWSDYFIGEIVLQIDNPIMIVDGEEQEIAVGEDVSPMLIGGRTMLPIRALVEEIGGEIFWEHDEQRITIYDDDEVIEMQIGSNVMYVNDDPVLIDVAPTLVGGRTMLPVRAITENLGFEVEWEPETQTVTLTRDFQTMRLIVRTRGDVNFSGIGATNVLRGPDNISVLQFSSIRETQEAFERLERAPAVVWVEPDTIVMLDNLAGFETLQTGFYSLNTAHRSWGVERIGADIFANHLRQNGRAHQPVVVAVLDTGVASAHPFLSGRVLQGRCFITNNTNPYDIHGHGTHVAGTVVDATPGLNVQILPVKVLSNEGPGTSLNINNGIRWAASRAEVINMSLGGRHNCQFRVDVVQYAIGRNTTVVVSAGNSATDARFFSPAHISSVITVAATDFGNRGASFTNWGPAVDLAAPGVSINSSVPNGGFRYKQGTSMAAPHVAAAAAMYIMYNPGITPAALQAAFRGYVDVPVGWNGRYGSGIINIARALSPDAGGSITLNPPGDWTFPAANRDYPPQTPHSVTVNAGNQATGTLTVALSGANANSFELSRTSIPNIPANGNATFTVAPRTGLAAGTYTATVTVSGVNVVSRSFVVSFSVAGAPEEPPPPPDGFINIRGELFSTSLTKLDLSFRNLRSEDIVQLRYMTNLSILHLHHNQISDLTPLSGLVGLELLTLLLDNNQISDLTPLSGLNVTVLSLNSNQISDLTPLSGMTSLQQLMMLNNRVSDLTPLSGLTNLFHLYLGNNQISDLTPLSGLTSLRYLALYGNPITDWSPVSHVLRVFGRPGG